MDRKQEIIKILKENDFKEIPFLETKQHLLEKGYTETEIGQAVYESPYDGKKNVQKSQSPIDETLKANPELVQKMGTQILEEDRKEEMQQAIAMGVAAKLAPGTHARSKYTFEFFEILGLPFFSIFFGLGVLWLIVYKLNLPTIINQLTGVAVGAWVIWTFYRRYLKK